MFTFLSLAGLGDTEQVVCCLGSDVAVLCCQST